MNTGITHFKKGNIPWSKGKKRSDMIGNTFSKNNPPNITSFKKGGIPWNKETNGIMKKNKTTFAKGQKAWNKGLGWTESQREKLMEFHNSRPNIKFKNTSIEIKMKELLDCIGVNYLFQHNIRNIALVDFYIPEKNLIIECDGCYWHGCPIHHPNRANSKDSIRDNKLSSLGYKVIRFWEHEINNMLMLNI